MTKSNPVTVVLVDDHPVVRDGLESMLTTESDIQIVGEAQNGGEALEIIPKLRPNIVIIDLMLPDMDGADVIRTISSASSDTRFIVLTSLAGDEQIYRALEAGARGYLFKDMARKQLVIAIRTVQQGQRYIPAEVGSKIAETFPRMDLTFRELEILEMIAGGLQNKQIAPKLNLAETTVNSHVCRILEKLNASDRTQAVTIALRRGIIRL